jgi:hypothetical protein
MASVSWWEFSKRRKNILILSDNNISKLYLIGMNHSEILYNFFVTLFNYNIPLVSTFYTTFNNLFVTIIEQVALNKSSLLLKNNLQNTQALQPSTINIKTESIYQSY